MANSGISRHSDGFTLVELLITVAIIGVLSAVAIPYFTDYVDTASEGVMRTNMETIRLFEEDYRLSEGTYVAGTYDPANPNAAGGLKSKLGWEPRTTGDLITYVVDNVSASGYRITATDQDGYSIASNCTKNGCTQI